MAGNKGPRGCSITSPPTGLGKRMERKWQKLVCQDKGSLTEQPTKRTVTTTIRIRRIYKTKQRNAQGTSHHPMPHVLLSRDQLAPRSAPPPRTQHDGTWCQIPCFVWSGCVSPPGCVPSWLLVKINPVLAEPRTLH